MRSIGLIRSLLAIFSIAMMLSGLVSARDIAAITASRTLVVAVPNVQTPPFFFEENGELKGLDIDLAKAIAESLGVRAVFNREARSFNEAVQLVERGRADIAVAKISRTLPRAQTVLFTEPYIVLPHALLVNRLRFAEIARGRPIERVLQDFSGSIGVIANSAFVGYARVNFPKAAVMEFPSWEAVIEAVTTGKVTAAYRDAFEAKRIFKIRPQLSLAVRSVVIEDVTDTIGIAVGAGQYHLHNYINLFLVQRNIKYTTDQILTRYEKHLQ